MHLNKIPYLIRFVLSRYCEKREQFYGLDNLDHKLKSYLPWWSGFFVEVGANDGITQSNTCYFERKRNWRGLLIEPIPEIAERCRLNRPNSIVEQYALVGPGFKRSSIKMQYCNLMSTVNDNAVGMLADADRIQRGAEDQRVKSYEITVPVQTLAGLLKKHGITKIDFLSLDIEGYELDALMGLNIQHIQPLFMLIEHGDRDDIMQYLEPYYDPVCMLSMANRDVLYKAKNPNID